MSTLMSTLMSNILLNIETMKEKGSPLKLGHSASNLQLVSVNICSERPSPRTSHARRPKCILVKNTGDHNASRLVKIQISTTISKFRSAKLRSVKPYADCGLGIRARARSSWRHICILHNYNQKVQVRKKNMEKT
jgi:hypothetical protein